MKNSITNTYKNKEYGWYVVYIFIIVVSFRIAGLIGLIASVLVISGLYKVAKNSEFSKKKKVLLSAVYVVCGIVGIIVTVSLFKGILEKTSDVNFVSEPAAKEILDAKSLEPFKNVSKIVDEKNDNKEYLSEVNNFKINLPDGWVINQNAQNNIIVEFDDPTPNQLGAMTIGSDENVGNYSVKEYSAGIMEGMREEGADNVQIIKQEEIILNGNPAYSIEFNYDYKLSNETYKMHALSVALIHKGKGYAILCVTQDETWGLYSQSFWKSLSSFTFLDNGY